MVTYNMQDVEAAKALYTCRSHLSDANEAQENSVVCDSNYGQWKNPANIFCLNESSLPYEKWSTDSLQTETKSTILTDLFEEALVSNDTSGIDLALLDYLNSSCFMMANSVGDSSKFVVSLLPTDHNFEITSMDLGLQTVHSNVDCARDSSGVFGIDYVGSQNSTASGFHCQAWAEVTPHKHTFTDAQFFADANFNDVKNYCRNPNNLVSGPWCYTTNSSVEWEFCDIPKCHKFELHVSLMNATDGGPEMACGSIKFYTADVSVNETVKCSETPTGPFGSLIKLTADASQPLFVCRLKPHGVESVSGCKEPPHRRGWTMVSFDGYSLGDQANYTCAKGFHYKQGTKRAECTRNRSWSGPSLVCSDEPNLAINGTTLRDNDPDTCIMLTAEVDEEIWLASLVEVQDVVLIVQKDSSNGTSARVEVQATIQDGTTRELWDVIVTEEGYFTRSLFQPITDHLTIRATHDIVLCEVKVFGRNSNQTLECTQQRSVAADYKGHLNISSRGFDCVPWTEHNRIPDFIFGDGNSTYVSNYCRNFYDTFKNRWYSDSRPVCFYRDEHGGLDWDYCEVFPCDFGCRIDQVGVTYRGEIDNTGINSTTGRACERWDSGVHRFKRKKDFADEATNHAGCRNPGMSQERPWCITDSSADPFDYEYCNIPECPKTSEIEWTLSIDLNNQSEIDALNALTPHFRECICTDKDHRFYSEPDLFNQLAYQFCDSYAGKHKEVMCHHRPSQTEAGLFGDGAKWSRIFIVCPQYPETIQPTLVTDAPTLPVDSSTDDTTERVASPTMIDVESSTGVTAMAATEAQSCPSDCSITCLNISTSEAITEEKMQELLQDIQRRMYVDTANLSKTKRKKISATDERPSSQATGAVAITILVLAFIFLVSGDIIVVIGYFVAVIKDCH
ncbi:plasminogen [Plakobranchus ocellatus]|uniref:Plasminogen n=1 Tax=Plakobranchus ocellatus TaxID=259542 RepID=A0AAV4CAH4_9GAST|nr:plasminogen [Plakobranchus ocellatus]